MTNAPQKERSSFSEEEGQVLLDHAAASIMAALTKKPRPPFAHPLATSPVAGVFVSLKRGVVLRSCCGSLSEKSLNPLGELLQAAAERSALADVRFPSITIKEWPSLDLEVSVMHHLQVMPTNPNLRINNLTIGRHGLIISHNNNRGLLLPQVAAENNWDAPSFLQQVCRKASLPEDTWLRPDAELKQFSATIFHRYPEKRDIHFDVVFPEILTLAFQYASELVEKGPERASTMPPQLSMTVSPTGWGILIQSFGNQTEAAFQDSGSLGELINRTARSIHQPGKPDSNKIKEFLAFSHPIPLIPEDFPKRLASIQKGNAVTAQKGDRTAVVIKQGPQDPIDQALRQFGQQPSSWATSGVELHCHLVTSLLKSEERISSPPLVVSKGIRLPAVAGTFYPNSAEALKTQLDGYFATYNQSPKRRVRAVMLPHAGWKFCGDIVAETLGQIEIPDFVVVIGPKHTPLGSKWSISDAKSWQIPGAEIKLDEESVAYFASRVKGLEKEELAHQKEHCVEVLLPFLHYLNPKVKIAPILIGSGTHDQLVEFGRILKRFRERLDADGDGCLFVISSDMNHFAEEKINRELDQKALDAFITGDTQKLFDTCTEYKISMCGMRPAVAVISSLGVDAKRHCPDIEIIRYETSARISNDPKRVVGYAGALLG